MIADSGSSQAAAPSGFAIPIPKLLVDRAAITGQRRSSVWMLVLTSGVFPKEFPQRIHEAEISHRCHGLSWTELSNLNTMPMFFV